MRILRTEAWLLVLGAFGFLTVLGGVLFLASLEVSGRLVPWPVGFLGVLLTMAGTFSGIAYIASGLKTVKEGERWAIEIFGSFSHIAHPGLIILLPGMEKVRERVSILDQVSDVSSETLTKDLIELKPDSTVFWHILKEPDGSVSDDNIYLAVYGIVDRKKAIEKLATTTLRDVLGTMDYDDATDNQDQINQRVREIMIKTTIRWGSEVLLHQISDINPPASLRDAQEKKIRAEKEKFATVTAAQAANEATILAAQAQKEKVALESEAHVIKESRDTEAEQIRIEGLKKAWGGDLDKALQVFLGEQGLGVARAAAENPKGVTIIGMPTNDILGGGVTAILGALQTVSGKGPASTAPTPLSPSQTNK